MPGWSHSMIMLDGKTFNPATPKMLLGTSVHNYLNEPEKYNHDPATHGIVKTAAVALKEKIGVLYKYVEPEVAITANFCYNGFVLNYKGRLDEAIINRIVIDIKVSAIPLQKSKEYFGYDNQISGYAIGINAPLGIIIRVDPETCKNPNAKPIVQVYNVPISHNWWMHQIMKKGIPE